MSVSVRRPAPPVSALVAEHLLCRATLLLWGGWLALDGLAWLLALILELCTLLRTINHRGDLAAFSHRYRPPGQSWGFQLMAHRVDESGDIDEVGHWLGLWASTRGNRLWDNFSWPVVDHGRATNCIKCYSEDRVVQGEGAVAGSEMTHSYRLQAGELCGGVAGDGCDGDVGQPHGTVGWGGWRSARVSQDHHLISRDKEPVWSACEKNYILKF